jgi:hypothetical protein
MDVLKDIVMNMNMVFVQEQILHPVVKKKQLES